MVEADGYVRIEIGQKKVAVVLRQPTDASGRVLRPIMANLHRTPRRQ
jgi:hypothetical protein